ncbi:MAG: gamma-glutamylcysteine synthetase [Bifidobacteriaceae bacterium]|jgi:glutamate--cysteine ligase|nr:gamma-glutamylcysteine synthetase [Bifidobacteriaceae bacterium]
MRTANKKHIASFVQYFESGIKGESDKKIGLELEHLILDKNQNYVSYYADNGIESILEKLRVYYKKESKENGHLIGLESGDAVITLEPGGQFELSIRPCASASESFTLYEKCRNQVVQILHPLGLELVNLGYQPKTPANDIDIIPKNRYKVFDELFINDRVEGKKMMRGTASTQISLDYFSEEDAIEKFQHFFALGPIWALLFTNTPYFEGEKNKNPLIRSKIWHFTDSQRAGIIKDVFDKDFSFEKYAVLVDTIPLLVTENGNALGKNAAQAYPDRELTKDEIEYIISNLFFDVRQKNFLELRTVDSLSGERLYKFMNSVYSAIYEKQKYAALKNLLGELTFERVKTAKISIMENGFQARPYGKSLEQFKELLL